MFEVFMKKVFLAMIIVTLSASMAFCADDAYQYEVGNQVFSFQAGITLPGFFWFFNDTSGSGFAGGTDTHHKFGGIGSLSYMYFVSPRIALGGSIGYSFNYALSGKLMTQIPLMARASWYAVTTPKFDLITSLSLGVTFNRYNESFYASPSAELEIQPVFYINENWGIGISGSLSTSAEIYWKDKKDDSCIAGMIPIKLTCHYRH